MENTNEIPPRKAKRRFDIIYVFEVAVGYAVGYAFGLQLIFLIPSAVLGFALAYFFVIKKNNYEKKWIRILPWSNLVTWIIPFLGVFVSIFTLQVGKSAPSDKKRLIILGTLGLLLSVANFAFGIYLSTGKL